MFLGAYCTAKSGTRASRYSPFPTQAQINNNESLIVLGWFYFYFLNKFIYLFIYLVFRCIGSLLLHTGFL